MTDDERAVRAVQERWMAATRAGDLAAVLELMEDDAVFLVPGDQPFGKATFAAASEGMADLRIDATAEVAEVQVNGDWAWMRSRLEVEVTPPSGPVTRRSGWTLTILRKGPDGRWRLARDANLLAPV